MKGIHTSDWHLGKMLHGVSLLQEQREQIGQITELIRKQAVDFVVISGDLYDRAIPPTEAIDLWEATLEEWAGDLGVRVFAIAGNHDSAVRLSFGHRFLEKQKVSILGDYSRFFQPLTWEKDGLQLAVYFLPYLDTAYVREIMGMPEEGSREALVQAAVDRVKEDWSEDCFHLLLAHEFLLGGTTSDSERPLSLGGNQAISYEVFEDFDYAALGHLHRAQRIGTETIRYAGGLYPYSFSEAGRVPSVELIELEPDRSLKRTRVEIPPKRTLKTMEGSLSQVLAQPETDDYLSVRISDREVILDLMGKLRDRFPNTLRVERGLPVQARQKEDMQVKGERESTEDLFEGFFKTMTDESLSQTQKTYLRGLVHDMERGDQA